MIILYTILAIIAVLAAVLLINTALQVRNARTTEGQHPIFTDDQLKVSGKPFSRILQCAPCPCKVATMIPNLPSSVL